MKKRSSKLVSVGGKLAIESAARLTGKVASNAVEKMGGGEFAKMCAEVGTEEVAKWVLPLIANANSEDVVKIVFISVASPVLIPVAIVAEFFDALSKEPIEPLPWTSLEKFEDGKRGQVSFK